MAELEQTPNPEELWRYWVLEKLAQQYDLLSIIAHDADPARTKQALQAHALRTVMHDPGFRPPDTDVE